MKGKRKLIFKKMQQACMLFICLLISLNVAAQNSKSITGTVLDELNEPVAGVSVFVKSTAIGTATDVQGKFELSVPDAANKTLVFSYIGYKTQELPIGQNTNFSIVMQEDVQKLEDVVVIGYGSVKRKDVTTSISSVSTRDISERPIISAAQAIQGKAAGISVVEPNGAPGGETVIRVRGTTSMNAENSPLYVVDGVPVDNLNFLSPSDISDIQILKDASSAAIYGSRGANGVVLISTKRGSDSNMPRVAFNAQYGLRKLSNPIESLNALEYKDLMEEIRPGSSAAMGTKDITNWYDETYQTSQTQNYQLSVAKSIGDLNYFLSGGYLDEKGIISSAWFRRYSFRTNVNDKIFNWLSIGANISYSDNKINKINSGNGSNRGGLVLSVINLPTSLPVINSDTGYYNRVFYGQNINNPVEAINNGKDNFEYENRLIASGNIQLIFSKRLNLKTTYSLDRRNAWNTNFTPIVHVKGIDEYGSAKDERNMNTVQTFDNVLTWQNNYDKHNLEVMAGSSWTDSYYTNSWINGSNFLNNDIKTLNAANKITWNDTGSGASAWNIMSYFARASYNYDSKYLLTANIRADGSSKLHPNYRWGYFPSFSAAWRISSESFMQNVKWINDLKLRGGWGKTGNQSGLNDYAYLERYKLTRQQWWVTGQENAVPVIQKDNLAVKDLTWEKTASTGIGIDLTAFDNRLTFTAEWYYKLTTDMLLKANVPAGQVQTIQRNGGSMTNRGVEFMVTSHNFRKRFIWDTNFNISFNRNKLRSLDLTEIYYDVATSDAFHGLQVVRNEPGRPVGGFYGYISDGVDPETGELMYRDLNKDGKITATDRTYIGDPNPDFIYGMTNTFSWKNFNLNIFIQGTYGNDIFNSSKVDTEGMYDLKNQSVHVLDRWRTPGQITDVPKANFDLRPSSYFVEDGSYIRLKDVTLSYNFNAALLRKIGISKIQPFFTATNLITITKYSGMDPEVNQWGNNPDNSAIQGIDWGTYPQSRAYTFGLNIEF
jgi:TonB-linked SusC/RagA family outer membrane protein